MGKKLIVVFLFLFFISFSSIGFSSELNKEYRPTRVDWLKVVVGNYIWGFNEFDTSLVVHDDGSINVGIYYDMSTQSREKASQLKERFEEQIPMRLKQYAWARNIKLIVSVYSEDRSGRGY